MGTREPWTAPHFFLNRSYRVDVITAQLVEVLFPWWAISFWGPLGHSSAVSALPCRSSILCPTKSHCTCHLAYSPGVGDKTWEWHSNTIETLNWVSTLAPSVRKWGRPVEIPAAVADPEEIPRWLTDWLTCWLTDHAHKTARTRWSTRSLQSCWAEDLKIWFSELGHFSHGRGCPPSHSMWLLVCAGSCMVGILELDERWGFWLVVATFDWNESRVCYGAVVVPVLRDPGVLLDCDVNAFNTSRWILAKL